MRRHTLVRGGRRRSSCTVRRPIPLLDRKRWKSRSIVPGCVDAWPSQPGRIAPRRAPAAPPLEGEEIKIYDVLDDVPRDAEGVGGRAGTEVLATLRVLSSLELAGLAVAVPGARWVRGGERNLQPLSSAARPRADHR